MRYRTANAERLNASARATYHASDKPAIMFRQRARRFGMTPTELTEFLAANPFCGLCGEAASHIDHCHATGIVRGHLCHHCNVGLGHFKEDVVLMNKAIDYLNRFRKPADDLSNSCDPLAADGATKW